MLNQPPRRSQRQPKRVYARRRWGLALGLMLLLMIPVIVWADVRWNKPLTAGLTPAAASADTKKFTVLLLGADDRPGEPGRSDTMLLGFVDLNAGNVNLLSVPRDSYVNIPGHGADKINAAYAFGKEQLTKPTVEQMIGQPIDYTFVVNMQGFQSVVDAVGGVDINIDEDMNYEDPYDTPPLSIHLTKGPHHLYGLDALHYVRFRHDAQSDWGRMARQQNFLKALLQAVKKPQNIAQLPKLLSLVFDPNVVRTNLSLSQLTQLATIAKDKLGAQSIASQTLQGEDWWSPEAYYLVLNFAEMRSTIHKLAGQNPDDPTIKANDAQATADYLAMLTKNGYRGAKATTTTGSTSGSGSTSAPKPTAAPSTTADGKGTGTSVAGSATGTAAGATNASAGGQNAGSPGAGSSAAGAAGATNAGAATGGGTVTAGGSTTPPATTPPTTPPPTTETPQAPDAGPPWPLVVVDGSGGTAKALLAKLEAEGYHVVSVQQASGIQRTTIVWYNGSAQAYYHLQALLPNATPKHMTPGTGDPPLKLILGADTQ